MLVSASLLLVLAVWVPATTAHLQCWPVATADNPE